MSLQDVVEACTVCFYSDQPLSKRPCCSKPVCVPCMQRWVAKCKGEQEERQRAESMQAQRSRTRPQGSRRSQHQRQLQQGQTSSSASRSTNGGVPGAGEAFVATCPNCRQEITLEGDATVREDQYLTGVRDQLSVLAPILQGSYTRDCTVCELCGGKASSFALLRSRSWTEPLCTTCYEQNQSEVVPVADIPNTLRKRIQDRLDFLVNLQKSLATSSQDDVADLPARLLSQRQQFLVDRQRTKNALQASSARAMARFEASLKQRQREVDRACDQSLREVQLEVDRVQHRLKVLRGRAREMFDHLRASQTATKGELEAKRSALKSDLEQDLSRISGSSTQKAPAARVPSPVPLPPAVPQLPDVRLPMHTISFARTMGCFLSTRDTCVITPGASAGMRPTLCGHPDVSWQSPMQAPRFSIGSGQPAVPAVAPKEEEGDAIKIEENDTRQHRQQRVAQLSSGTRPGRVHAARPVGRSENARVADVAKRTTARVNTEQTWSAAKAEDSADEDEDDDEDDVPLSVICTNHSRRLTAVSAASPRAAKRRASETRNAQGPPPKAATVAGHNQADDDAQHQLRSVSRDSASAAGPGNHEPASSRSSRGSDPPVDRNHDASDNQASSSSPSKSAPRRRRPRLKDYDHFDEEDVPLDRYGKPIVNETMLHALLKRASNRFDTLARIFPGVSESFWQKYEGKQKVKFPQRVIDLAAAQATRRVLMYNTDDETLLATTECPREDEVTEHEYHYPMNKRATEAQIDAHFSNKGESTSSTITTAATKADHA